MTSVDADDDDDHHEIVDARPPEGENDPAWRMLNQSLFTKYVYDYKLQINGITLPLKQANVQRIEEVGLTAWDGSIILAHYLQRRLARDPTLSLREARVLEVGSGIGIAGFAAALLGAHVTLTDHTDEVLDLLRTNAERARALIKSEIRIERFHWGDDSSHLGPPFGFVIGGDVLYNAAGVEPLLSALNATTDEKSVVLLCCEAHNPEAIAEFQRLAPRDFYVTDLPHDESLDEQFRLPTVHLFELRRRSPHA